MQEHLLQIFSNAADSEHSHDQDDYNHNQASHAENSPPLQQFSVPAEDIAQIVFRQSVPSSSSSDIQSYDHDLLDSSFVTFETTQHYSANTSANGDEECDLFGRCSKAFETNMDCQSTSKGGIPGPIEQPGFGGTNAPVSPLDSSVIRTHTEVFKQTAQMARVWTQKRQLIRDFDLAFDSFEENFQRILTLEDQVDTLIDQNEHLVLQLSDLDMLADNLEAHNEALHEEARAFGDLRLENDDLQHEILKLQATLEEHQTAIDKLNAQIRDMQDSSKTPSNDMRAESERGVGITLHNRWSSPISVLRSSFASWCPLG